nr:integrase, catalytic region, zinc finger, CCHC-type, peptidase aspartic, catalytic [Tanacetum cinerariifolium]
MQKEGTKTQTQSKVIQVLKKEEKKEGSKVQFHERSSRRGKAAKKETRKKGLTVTVPTNIRDKKLDLTFFRVFGALCYPTNDSEDLGKLQPTADTGIFVGMLQVGKGIESTTKGPDVSWKLFTFNSMS